MENTGKCGGWISKVKICVQRCVGQPLQWECSHSNPCVPGTIYAKLVATLLSNVYLSINPSKNVKFAWNPGTYIFYDYLPYRWMERHMGFPFWLFYPHHPPLSCSPQCWIPPDRRKKSQRGMQLKGTLSHGIVEIVKIFQFGPSFMLWLCLQCKDHPLTSLYCIYVTWPIQNRDSE